MFKFIIDPQKFKKILCSDPLFMAGKENERCIYKGFEQGHLINHIYGFDNGPFCYIEDMGISYSVNLSKTTLMDLLAAADEITFKMTAADFRRTYDRYISAAEKNIVTRIPYQVYRDVKNWKITCEKEAKDIFIRTDSENKEKIIFGWTGQVRSGKFNFIPKEHPLFLQLFMNGLFWKNTYEKTNLNTEKASIENSLLTLSTSNERKENNTMKTNFNFEFGPVKDGIKFSPFGLAILNKEGNYVTYKDGGVTDTMGITFDIKGMAYKMPVAIKDLKVNDLIINKGKPVYITAISGNDIEVVDVYEGEKKTVIPTKNVFGFNFVTKVVSFVNFEGMNPNSDNPFGNILPFLMLSEDTDFFGGDNNDMMKFFAVSAMMGGGANPFAALMPAPAEKDKE